MDNNSPCHVMSETRAWAVTIAAVFCLSAVGYRVMTAPDINPTVERANIALDIASSALPATLSHVQATSDAATKLLDEARPAVRGLTTTEKALNASIDLTSHRLNDLCLPGPCGTLADTNRTLATLRGTSGEVERSLLTFNRHEGDLFTQESIAYGQFQTTMTDIDHVAGDQDILALIGNARTISGDAAAMTTDGRGWLHQKLYPTKRKGFISGFEATGDVAKHWMPPLF